MLLFFKGKEQLGPKAMILRILCVCFVLSLNPFAFFKYSKLLKLYCVVFGGQEQEGLTNSIYHIGS
jgi:hypothetical protein